MLSPRAEAAAAPLLVRVGLSNGRPVSACTLSSRAPLVLHDAAGREVAQLASALEVRCRGEQIQASWPGGGAPLESDRLTVSSGQPVEATVAGGPRRAYRGRIFLWARRGGLVIVNELDLEDYLRGVVPAEIPAAFAPAAVQAQAIAARTYALATAGRHAAEGYDLCDGSHCQVYLGAAAEDPRADAAVFATAGLIATYGGQPIQAVYHDCCGGRTASNEATWSGSTPLPYLRPIADCHGEAPNCARAPNAVWTRQVPQARLAAALSRFGVTAPIAAIEPVAVEENGRPREFRIRSAAGEVTLLAGALRTAVNDALGWDTLPSADFVAAPNGDAIVFAGRGSGHGVGLCQWGADGLAKAGRSAAEIIAHYYPGVTVTPITPELARRLSSSR